MRVSGGLCGPGTVLLIYKSMGSERSATVRKIFEAALTRPESERPAYLGLACGGDQELRSEVESLLEVAQLNAKGPPEASAVTVLDRPPVYEPPRFPPDEVLSKRFRIGRLIGRGGMGEVYEAFDLELNHRIALKTIRGGANSKAMIARLRHEVVLARQVTHPNVCRIFDLGQHVDRVTAEEVAYLTMELLEGDTLAHRIQRRRRMAPAEALPIAEQMAEALAAAHRAGVIHRDLKPANVILVRQKDDPAAPDRSVITDFGLARVLDGAEWANNAAPTYLTGSGEILGTLVYMAPEQIRGQSITAATDIYALGLMLYQMFSGRRPYEEFSSLATIFKRLEGPPPAIRSIVPQLDPRLAAAIMRCLEVDPANRFQSAYELAETLRQLEKSSLASASVNLSSSSTNWLPAVPEVRRGIALESSSPTSALQIPIAVLPFTNLGPGTENEYFSDGLGEELMAALGKVAGLRLAARASSFRFRGGEYDVRDVGRQLSVDAVLEGSVRRAGNRLRVAVQLVDTAEGYQLWSEMYDRQLEDVFEVQEEIANAVAGQLKLHLTNSAESYFRRHRTRDIEAYNLYLKGRYFWNKRTETDLQKAIEHFDQATQLDPNFAPALAGLADSYVTLAMYGALPPLNAFPQAKQAIEQALILDAKLPQAHCTAGCIRAVFDWDWGAAEQSFRKCLELGPNYATGHHWFAINFLVPMQRLEEAQRHLQLARETDPLSLVINTTIGLEKFFERRYEDAVREYRRVLEMEPSFAMGYFFLGQALERRGAISDAIAALERSVELSGRSAETVATLGYTYAAAGRRSEALVILQELKHRASTHYVSPVLLAQVQLGLEANEEALKSLEDAYKVKATDLLWIGVRPIFEPLKTEPRFQAIVESIGLA